MAFALPDLPYAHDALEAAIDARTPALIDVPLGALPDPWSIVRRMWTNSGR